MAIDLKLASIAAGLLVTLFVVESAQANREPPAPPVEASSEPVEAEPSARYAEGVAAVDAGNYEKALEIFADLTAVDPTNADAFNMLGYTHRRLQNFSESIRNYQTALQIDPQHTGAHQYIGEAYLEINNLEMAEKHLQELNLICLFGCDDFEALEQAVTLYRHNYGQAEPTG